MKRIIIIALLLLAGCGEPAEVHITYTVVDRPTLETMCDEDYKCYGYAVWHDIPGASSRLCAIYILPRKSYTDYMYYHIIKHEKRHCYEGDFH